MSELAWSPILYFQKIHQHIKSLWNPLNLQRNLVEGCNNMDLHKDLTEFGLKLGKEELDEKTHDRLVWKTLILYGAVPNNGKMPN